MAIFNFWGKKEEKGGGKRPMCPHCCVEMVHHFRYGDIPQRMFQCPRCKRTIERSSPWTEKDLLCLIHNDLQQIRILLSEHFATSCSTRPKDQDACEPVLAQEASSNGTEDDYVQYHGHHPVASPVREGCKTQQQETPQSAPESPDF